MKLKLKSLLTRMLHHQEFKVVMYTGSGGGGTSYAYEINVALNGYTALGVVGWHARKSVNQSVYNAYLKDQNTVQIADYNSTDSGTDIDVYVLYQRN